MESDRRGVSHTNTLARLIRQRLLFNEYAFYSGQSPLGTAMTGVLGRILVMYNIKRHQRWLFSVEISLVDIDYKPFIIHRTVPRWKFPR